MSLCFNYLSKHTETKVILVVWLIGAKYQPSPRDSFTSKNSQKILWVFSENTISHTSKWHFITQSFTRKSIWFITPHIEWPKSKTLTSPNTGNAVQEVVGMQTVQPVWKTSMAASYKSKRILYNVIQQLSLPDLYPNELKA